MKQRTLYQFKNCRILRNHSIMKEDLWVRDGKIINPEKIFFDERILADQLFDCNGAIISPGFIDLQINGGFGLDFSFHSDKTEENLQTIAKGILAYGVTAFCPTIVTSPLEVYHKILPKIKRKPGGADGAAILGVHLEGPFISKEKKGAHPEQYIRTLDKGLDSLMETYGTLSNASIITLAPEIVNSSLVIKELTRRGITVSLGHSAADLSVGENAVSCGASFITHLFNAMLPFHHRDPGLVGLLTSLSSPQNIYYGIICDGCHTHPAALRIAYKSNPEGLVLVTDAISALGLQEGTHHIGQQSIDIRNSVAYIAGTDTLCGSITSLDACIRIFREATSCSVVNALEAATLHPAKALGIEKIKGTLDYGADADFVMLDDNLTVRSTWIAGECVYEAKTKCNINPKCNTNKIL